MVVGAAAGGGGGRSHVMSKNKEVLLGKHKTISSAIHNGCSQATQTRRTDRQTHTARKQFNINAIIARHHRLTHL